MKNRILKIVKFIFIGLIFSSIAALLMSALIETTINLSGRTWLLYIVSYILYPKIIPEERRLNKLHNTIYFIIFYFTICTIYLLYLFIR